MLVADCVSLILTCDRCHTIGLRLLPDCDGGLFFPSSHFTDDAMSAVRLVLKQIHNSSSGGWSTSPQLVSDLLLQLQVKQSGKVYNRLLFQAKLIKTVCCKDMDGLQWMRMDALSSLTSCWGPEPAILSHLLMQPKGKDMRLYPRLIESRLISNIGDFLPRPVAAGSKPELKRGLAAAAGFTKDHLKTLFQEFYMHSFPSQFWTLKSFRAYAKSMGWPYTREEDLRRLFHSFLPYGQMYLTFDDFVLGIGSMMKQVPHGGQTGFVRMQRIFRFYDDERNGRLSYDNMFAMRRDILKIKKMPFDANAVRAALVHDYASLGVHIGDGAVATGSVAPVTELQLLAAFAKLSAKGLRGFSSLYRMTYDVNQKRVYNTKQLTDSARCPQHKQAHIQFAAQSIVIAKSGRIPDNKIVEIDHQLAAGERSKAREQVSKNHISHRIFRLVHELADSIRRKNPGGLINRTCTMYDNSEDWTKVHDNVKSARIDLIKQMLMIARRMFVNDSRIPKTTSPCIVFGDIHGNLSDLLQYEKQFWPRFPFQQTNIVFLGDFVDRGKQSVEVFLYLIALKFLCPGRITMLRGNHETRSMHKDYGFYKECCRKFDRFGSQMWDEFNRVMDCMPVAALIDEQLFCCHGGIPLIEPKISNLMKMPCPLSNPAEEFPAAWEVLWSDPVETKDMSDMRMTIGSANTETESSIGSYIHNVKRSTGNFFDQEAMSRFNLLNGTTHLLRAHEQQERGYKISLGGIVVTVFSASAYARSNNISAVLLVQEDVITPCQVTT